MTPSHESYPLSPNVPAGSPATSSAPQIGTLGELKASGHVQKPLRTEVRDNLLAKLRAGEDP